MSDTTDTIVLSLDEVYHLALRVLTRHGLSDAHARAVARVITAGQRDECHSHGVYRLLTVVRTLAQGKVSGTAQPVVQDRTPALVAVDARLGFSPLAFEAGGSMPRADPPPIPGRCSTAARC